MILRCGFEMCVIYDKATENDIEMLTRFRLDYVEEDIGGVREDERDIIEERLPIYYREHLGKDFHVYVARIGEHIKDCVDIKDYGDAHDREDCKNQEYCKNYEACGEIVGCCFLLVTEKPANPNFINGLTGTVLNVYVKPEYRRQGIAKRMLENLLKDAKEMGLDYVELKSTEEGHELYKGLGFEDEVSRYYRMKKML